MIGQIPQNWWMQNQFMLPQIQNLGTRPPPGLIDLAPKTDASGILSTSGVQMPDYAGSAGGRGGLNGGGPGLTQGPAQFGLEAGQDATADTTTTATHDWRDVVAGALANAVPGIGSFYSVTGMTQQAKDLARSFAESLGLASPSGYDPGYTAPPGTVDYDREGLAGGPGAPQGANGGGAGGNPGMGEGSGSPTAGSSGPGGPEGGSEGTGSEGWAKGGPVMAHMLTGPNPPGPDQGMGGLMGGEFVVNAKAAKKHRGLLDAINSGASKAKIKGLLG